MKKVLLKIEYSGSKYHGWQIQPNGLTIEELIEKALQKIAGKLLKVIGCSRTDAGVHALGQVAMTTIPQHLTLHRLFISLNALLPEDVAIVDLVQVEPEFCVRKYALKKRYRYRINNCRIRQTMDFPYYWWVKDELDQSTMLHSAKELLGKHNYLAYQGKGGFTTNPHKEIYRLDLQWYWQRGRFLLDFVVEGDNFLKHMVRNMVGTLVDIGRGRLDAGAIHRAFQTLERADLGMTAPAHGLVLEQIFYRPDPFLERIGESWSPDPHH